MDWIGLIADFVFWGSCDFWFYLMQRIVPDKMDNEKVRVLLKILIGMFTIALWTCMLFGVIFLFLDENNSKIIGIYMIVIPLVISVIQIAGGIAILIKKNGRE